MTRGQKKLNAWLHAHTDEQFVLVWQSSASSLEATLRLGGTDDLGHMQATKNRACKLRHFGVPLKHMTKKPRTVRDVKMLRARCLWSAQKTQEEQDMTGSLSDARAERRYEELFDAGMTSVETENEDEGEET